jgi:folylpolyglutamate synthase/dihydropteroate synthase
MEGAELAARWRATGGDAEAAVDLADAWARASVSARTDDGPLIVAGSLYLVGAVRALAIPGEVVV